MEFHVSRYARDLYQFDQSLFSISGNVIFANFHGARLFTQKINEKRDLVRFPEQAVKAGQINAMGMIDEILHYVIGLYREQAAPQAFRQALDWLDAKIGSAEVDRTLHAFVDQFPPLAVYRREISVDEYLRGKTRSISNRQIALEELLMLWVTNRNPAMAGTADLFDDAALEKETPYLQVINQVHDFFETLPPFGPDQENLVDMLRAPAIAVPYSLPGQLEYIRQRWGSLIGKYLYRLLGSLDLIREEEKVSFFGPGPTRIEDYAASSGEVERFSPDRAWMPTLVLIAKNSYVWLDQLSKKYNRPIHRLDEIPDEEIDFLARSGFSGLWLIGLWERSRASEEIKQLMGNPEAVASAYSIFDYQIAVDLGGEPAYQNLKDRAWQRGIRLASDMVPNHMGIDSPWVMDHPEWFISLGYSPFPSYTFNGPNLSHNDRVSVYLEDHYYNRTDAAVVFKRADHANSSEQYIYHGNDGTSMPWNDTAQLNYLNPAVREAVIQTILQVARRFPIIRFDAAMTLTKKHYQRLWFPEPGTGGDIPSRADFSMTKDQFDALMPEEFWREVVDRVAKEAPDTLLLAEAFWLMESYFVRSLGMHRVYNSAFMNLIRNEENAEYRTLVKNTLEFDPEILKRFVNFMNNPDEKTAVEQFGKGDKYFGICTLMCTLPGLPMFGHGQIEGYAEKYGMEYQRAYLDEKPDHDLIRRHEREIFPLLHRRYLFAGVENFLLYDFFTASGAVDEDVYAFSNGSGNERALVVYHNKFSDTQGWIRTSAAYSVKNESGERVSIQKTLSEGLGLRANANDYLIFREQNSGLEFLRSSQSIRENGLYAQLGAYTYQVFLDFREVQDNEWGQYSRLNATLDGRGVPSIDEALKELFLQPIHQPFRELMNPGFIRNLIAARQSSSGGRIPPGLLDEVQEKSASLFRGVQHLMGGSGDPETLAQSIRAETETLLRLPVLETRYPLPGSRKYQAALAYLRAGISDKPEFWMTALGWIFVHDLGKAAGAMDTEALSRSWLDEWMLNRIISATAQQIGVSENGARQAVTLIGLLTSHQHWFDAVSSKPAYQVLETWMRDPDTQRSLGVNRYQDVLWFNKEAFEGLLWWMMFLAVVQVGSDPEKPAGRAIEQIISGYDLIRQFQRAADASGYQVRTLMDALATPPQAARSRTS